MPGRDIVTIGASAGGVEALRALVSGLPPDLPAALFIVLHLSPSVPSRLPEILARAGPLEVIAPLDGDPIEHGRIYVAQRDWHLLVEPGRVRVLRGPRVNSVRPAIDPLFDSAARAYGPRVIGVVLSGALDDGTVGLAAIKQRGGIAIVQNPTEALIGSMPSSALRHVVVDHCLPVAEIAEAIAQLSRDEAEDRGGETVSNGRADDPESSDLAAKGHTRGHPDKRPGAASGFSCPECNGSLWELRDGQLTRYECRVGHSYSTESMLAEQSSMVEAAVWAAINALQEQASFKLRLAHRLADQSSDMAERLRQHSRDAEEQADVLHDLLLRVLNSQRTAEEASA